MKIKLKSLAFILVILLLMFATITTASMFIPANERAKENAKAPENSPVIGGNWDLERVDFIHYAKPTNQAKAQQSVNCYQLLGAKWNTFPVNYMINPSNPQNLTESFIAKSISTSAETWDAATSKGLFNNVYAIDYGVVYGVQDFKNAITIGDYPDNNVIAITSVWFTRVGKKIVEFDQLYNTRFNWGDATINSGVMDLQNIATHELGHAVGLDDIYITTCSTVTMYGYSGYGDVQKRTLEQPDITGLQKMYGA